MAYGSSRSHDKYGRDEEGQCPEASGPEKYFPDKTHSRSVSGDEGGEMSAGDKGLSLSAPRQNGQGRNFKMSSSDPVSESGKQA